jgi:hypothetical protein
MSNNICWDKDYDLIIAIKYGDDGLVPCYRECSGSCIGRSGENFCGNYMGIEEELENHLFIVRCSGNVKCEG